MPERLSTLTLFETLRESARIFRANALFFIGMALFPALADLAGSAASVHPDADGASSPLHSLFIFLSYALSFVLWVAGIVLQAFSVAAICFSVTRLLAGEVVTIGSALRAVNPRAVRLIWVFLMMSIFSCWPLVVALVLARVIPWQSLIQDSWTSWAMAAFVFVFGGIPIAALFVRYALAPYACVIEDITPYSSIERSVDLGHGSRWKIFWACLVLMLPVTAVAWTLQWELEQHAAGFWFFARFPAAFQILDKLPDFAVQLIAAPFLGIVLTLLYLQLLEQKEGISLPDVLNGFFAARRSQPYEDEEPGPWDDVTDSSQEIGENSVGIPWSIFGAKDVPLKLQEEAGILEADTSAASTDSDSRKANEAVEGQV